MSATVNAVICIPSFRRPEGLRNLLGSLHPAKSEFGLALVVVDNDATRREALPVAEAFFASQGIEGLAVVEPRQGNVFAINTAFETALTHFSTARFFLMIDDDETAGPGWADLMVETAKRFDAAIVGGPVRRVFSGPIDASIANHPLFQSIETETGVIDSIHGSGNCLIARQAFEKLGTPPFDMRFNMLGGGDLDFFTRARRAGFRFAWSNEAVVSEKVGAARLTRTWLMQRSLRTGAINYIVDRRKWLGPFGWLVLAGKNVLSLGRGIFRFFRGALSPGGGVFASSHWLIMPAGRVLASFGWSPTPYKAKTD